MPYYNGARHNAFHQRMVAWLNPGICLRNYFIITVSCITREYMQSRSNRSASNIFYTHDFISRLVVEGTDYQNKANEYS